MCRVGEPVADVVRVSKRMSLSICLSRICGRGRRAVKEVKWIMHRAACNDAYSARRGGCLSGKSVGWERKTGLEGSVGHFY